MMERQHVTAKQVTLANLGLLLMAIIWGFGFIVTKDHIDIVTPWQVMCARFITGGVGLTIIFFSRVKRAFARIWKQSLYLGVLVFLSYGLQTVGIKYTSASNNAFLTTLYVIVIPWLVFFTSKQHPGNTIIICSLVTFVGVGLMSLSDSFHMNKGDIITVISSIIFGWHLLQVSIFTRDEDPIALAALQLLVCAVLSIIATSIFDPPFNPTALTTGAIQGMIYLGIVNTLLTFLLQFVCQKYTSPISASLIMSLESVFAAVFSFIFLGERLSPRAMIGAGLIFASIIVAQLHILRGVKANEHALHTRES